MSVLITVGAPCWSRSTALLLPPLSTYVRPNSGMGRCGTNNHFLRGYLASCGLMSYKAICDTTYGTLSPPRRSPALGRAGMARQLLQRPLELFSEEIRWINHHGIKSEAEYVRAERIGRSTFRLRRAERS
jgi:hypothetical protein